MKTAVEFLRLTNFETACQLVTSLICLEAKKHLHRPGIEPGPPAWQASILPLNHRCLWKINVNFDMVPEANLALFDG